MDQADEWVIVFYKDDKNKEPVREFIASLDLQAQARFDWSIAQLLARNVKAQEPLVRHLEGKIWELRRESTTNIYRVLYSFQPGKRIVFLHGFQKKTQKTPRSEIVIAQRRLEHFIARGGAKQYEN